jgi:hypothetical protein
MKAVRQISPGHPSEIQEIADPFSGPKDLLVRVKAAVLALAANGVATLWMVMAADVGASVAVILNVMRPRRMGS